MKVICLIAALALPAITTVHADDAGILTLKPGQNEISFSVSNTWTYDINASIHFNEDSMPSWLTVQTPEQITTFPQNDTARRKIHLVFNVIDLPDRETAQIPYYFEDALGNRWNNTLTVKVSGPETNQDIVAYDLLDNFPNPFNPSTTIKYSIARENHVSLKVFNMIGQEVKTLANEVHKPGMYSVQWDGKNNQNDDVAAGIYFYRLTSGSFTKTKKMTFVE